MSQRPLGYRASHAVGLAGTVLAAVLVAFVITAGYCATELAPGAPPFGGGRLVATNTVELATNVSVSNPGVYPIGGLVVQAQVRYGGANGSLIGTGLSPSTSVSADSSAILPVTLGVMFGPEMPSVLLTHDARLAAWFWANGTYALVFDVHLTLQGNLTWGAPFFGLAIGVGSPRPASEGSLAYPVSVSFTDEAQFPLVGQLQYTLHEASGTACGNGSIAIGVAAGGSYANGSTSYLASGCSLDGGSVSARFTSSAWLLALPSEALP
jgi:hypothetical protein